MFGNRFLANQMVSGLKKMLLKPIVVSFGMWVGLEQHFYTWGADSAFAVRDPYVEYAWYY